MCAYADENKLKKYLDIFEVLYYLKNMNNETIEQYYINFRKFENNEWTNQQWYDYCTMVLGELMNEHKDVFIRLKNR